MYYSILQVICMLLGIILLFGTGSKWSIYVIQWINSKDGIVIGKGYEPLRCGALATLGVLLCISSIVDIGGETKVIPHTYVIFLDTTTVKDTTLLNDFAKKINVRIVITSDDRFNKHTQTNLTSGQLKFLCELKKIDTVVIGSIPNTQGKYTKREEISLWYQVVKPEYTNYVIIDRNIDDKYTVKVEDALTAGHLLSVLTKLETKYDPNMFKIKAQDYDQFFKEKA